MATVPAVVRPDPLDQIIQLVVDSVSSPISTVMYARALAEFLRWVRGSGASFTKATLNAYKSMLEARGLSASSINIRLAAIRKLATEATDNGFMDPNIAAAVRRVSGVKRQGRRLGNWLGKAESKALLDAPDGDTIRGVRDRAVLAVMIGCGLRRNEVAELTFEHVQMREARWVIVDLFGKHGRVRSVPMPTFVKAAIDRWAVAGRISEGRIFRTLNRAGQERGPMTSQTVFRIVRTYSEQLGRGMAPHDLRRTHSQLAYKAGCPIDQIQLALGHQSIQTTEVYLGTRQNLERGPGDFIDLA